MPVSDCLLASERSNLAREQVLAWCREQGLAAFDRRTHTGLLRNLVVREGRRTGQLQVRLVTGPGDIDGPSLAAAVECDGLSWTTTDALAETTLGGETIKLAGNRTLEEELCGLSFSIAPNAFFQTNTEMAEQLYGIAGDLADLKGWERVYDLYCGIGTVGLSLAARAGEVWGLEIVEQAVANAISNAKRNGIGNAKFFAGDVRLALRELVEQAQPARRLRHRPAARRALAEGRAAHHRGRAAADRLHLLQPDDARAQRGAARRGRLRAQARRAGRHVPADPAHRVRGAAGARLASVRAVPGCLRGRRGDLELRGDEVPRR